MSGEEKKQIINEISFSSLMEKLTDKQAADEIILAKHDERITSVESDVKILKIIL